MLPLRDTIPSRYTPIVNYAMIGLCLIVYLVQASSDHEGQEIVERFGMIPARVWHPHDQLMISEVTEVETPMGTRLVKAERPLAPSPIPAWLTLLTCTFLHGGLMHFVGNMWFLFIFGDNVEDRLGHVGYLIFYLASGVLASLTHLLTNSQSTIPTVGASGAIAGVMGAYFYLYPKARVVTLVPIFIVVQVMVLPASIFLGIWFVLQFLQGVVTVGGEPTAGVAWWAHIGGFVVGLGAVALLNRAGWIRSAPSQAAEMAGWQWGRAELDDRRDRRYF